MSKNHNLLLNVVDIGKVMSIEMVYLFLAKNLSTAKQEITVSASKYNSDIKAKKHRFLSTGKIKYQPEITLN
ncbi:hypothetical protein OUO06_17470 [Photobacterium damselae]|uniref:hypothetical protein n=1 Tax=Photobacterium damselae TaxID=38293 RepID=UPI003C6DF642